MNSEQRGISGLHFTIFGIPVIIQHFSWLILGILGLLFFEHLENPLPAILLFIVVGMLSILAHEMGHAVVSRAFTRATPVIIISNLGGTTYHPISMPSRLKHFLMTLAGPLSGYMLGVLMALALGIQVGNPLLGVETYVLHPLVAPNLPLVLADMGLLHPVMGLMYAIFFMITFWWTAFNLMPILPMDGGQLLLTATNKPKLAAGIGLALSSVFAIYFISGGSIFMGMMLGYFAWINWQIFNYNNR